MTRYLSVLLLIGGCASETVQADDAQDRAAYREHVYAQCDSYGYQRGSKAFSDCLMSVDLANRQMADQLRGAILQEALQREYRTLPLCSSLPSGMSGYERAAGRCR